MALPDDFSPAQHLLSMLIGTHNRFVQKTFIGVPDADLEHPLGGMKLACLIAEDDTIDLIILRMFLYWFEFKGNLPIPVFGIQTTDFMAELQIPSKPQVTLKFYEDSSEFLWENNLSPAKSEISWRIMSQTSATITPAYAKEIALQIKEAFGEGNGFTWERGTVQVTYKDLPKGVNFRLLAESKSEAIRVIKKVLSLIDVPFQEKKVITATIDEIFPVVPPVEEIYGQLRKLPRKHPITTVRFRRAELSIYGLKEPVLLVDRVGGYDITTI